MKLRAYQHAVPIVESALMQVEWEAAAKEPEKALSETARALRTRTRQAMLTEFAPIMILNDWAEETAGPGDKPVDVRPLPSMNPATARGIMALRDRGLPHPHVMRFAWDFGRIRATARLTEPG